MSILRLSPVGLLSHQQWPHFCDEKDAAGNAYEIVGRHVGLHQTPSGCRVGGGSNASVGF